MPEATPQPTGLAGLVNEVKHLEQEVEALVTPSAPVASVAPAMVISNEPIPVPADAVPLPAAAPTAPIQSPALDALAKEEARVAALEAEKQAFYKRIADARAAGIPAPIITQPVPPRIMAQTQAEMAAGAAQVAKHAAEMGKRIIPVTLPTDGTMTPVFRPGDYVPDQKKGQGNVTSTPLT